MRRTRHFSKPMITIFFAFYIFLLWYLSPASKALNNKPWDLFLPLVCVCFLKVIKTSKLQANLLSGNWISKSKCVYASEEAVCNSNIRKYWFLQESGIAAMFLFSSTEWGLLKCRLSIVIYCLVTSLFWCCCFKHERQWAQGTLPSSSDDAFDSSVMNSGKQF